MTSEQERFVDPSSLKGLSHPTRLKLLAALEVRGTATASQLASDIAESSGTASYHLRQLERHGFIQDAPGAGNGRERWWQPVRGGWSFPRFELHANSATRESANFVTRRILQNTYQQTADFLDAATDWPSDWQSAALRYEWHFQLNPEQVSALNAEVMEILTKYKAIAPGAGSRRVLVEGTTFPMGRPDQPGIPSTEFSTDKSAPNDQSASETQAVQEDPG